MEGHNIVNLFNAYLTWHHWSEPQANKENQYEYPKETFRFSWALLINSILPEDILWAPKNVNKNSKQKIQKFLEELKHSTARSQLLITDLQTPSEKSEKEKFNFNHTNFSAKREDIQSFLWRLKDWDVRFTTMCLNAKVS